MQNNYIVRAFWDDDAQVWCAEGMNFFGLATEAETLDGLMVKIPDMISDLREANHELESDAVPLQLLVETVTHGRHTNA